jgi:uncharacterized protein YndB with AHSA1/START domain
MAMTEREVRIKKRFDVAADRVFAAWLDRRLAPQFLFATPDGEMVEVELDPVVGGAFNFTERRDGKDVAHIGRYLEIDPPRRLVFEFRVSVGPPESTRVTIEITPTDGGGCELSLVHEGVPEEFAQRDQHGWQTIVDELDRVLR